MRRVLQRALPERSAGRGALPLKYRYRATRRICRFCGGFMAAGSSPCAIAHLRQQHGRVRACRTRDGIWTGSLCSRPRHPSVYSDARRVASTAFRFVSGRRDFSRVSPLWFFASRAADWRDLLLLPSPFAVLPLPACWWPPCLPPLPTACSLLLSSPIRGCRYHCSSLFCVGVRRAINNTRWLAAAPREPCGLHRTRQHPATGAHRTSCSVGGRRWKAFATRMTTRQHKAAPRLRTTDNGEDS